MKKTILILMISLLFLLSFVNAVGVCELNKNNYIPGEQSTLGCSCTLPQEENRPGYIVYIHNNGSILSSTSVTSGGCRASVFGGSYTFPSTLTNYNGTAIFSLNADGTGSPVSWEGDITEDSWVVNGSSDSDCIIEFEVEGSNNPIFDLGRHASLSIEVEDGNTFSKIIGARCSLHIESLNDIHIFSVPYNPPYNYITSTANGEVAFEVALDYSTLEPQQTYIVKAYCYCPSNSSNPCYFEGNGLAGNQTGFKSCVSELLADSGEDYRGTDPTSLFLILAIIVVFTLIGLAFRLTPMVIFAGIIQFIYGLVWLYSIVKDIDPVISKGIGMVLCLTGLALILSYVGNLFDKKKREREIEVEIG